MGYHEARDTRAGSPVAARIRSKIDASTGVSLVADVGGTDQSAADSAPAGTRGCFNWRVDGGHCEATASRCEQFVLELCKPALRVDRIFCLSGSFKTMVSGPAVAVEACALGVARA